jgi:hypothetical protein
MINEQTLQRQIEAHKESLIQIIELVQTGQWNGQEAMELGVKPTELFHIRFIGGTRQTCDMIDNLFKLIIQARKVCLDV